MTKDEAMKLALDALEADELDMVDDGKGNMVFRKEQAITALKAGLAQPEQETEAWPCVISEADFSEDTVTLVMQCTDYKVSAGKHWLSTTPPQRKPLTDEQIFACENSVPNEVVSDRNWCIYFARAIEAAHGIKE